MYPNGTILTRPEPKGDEYDEVKVVGPSPIRKASFGEWEGAAGDILIVIPVSQFAAPLNIPTSVLESEWEVTEWPEEPDQQKIIEERKKSLRKQESPEQIFAREARERAKAKPRKAAASEQA